MSALMDQLLYAGDDSGDEDELNARPMSSFSARLPSTSAFALAAHPPGVLEPPAGVVASALSAMGASSVSAPVASMVLASATTAPPRPIAASAGTARLPDSGDELFPQTFAMLKQMLPPEQYAAIYSDARNGNSNDAKSIADIIKRTTGGAIVASVTQRINLARYQLAGVQSGTPAPQSSATVGARSTPLARALTTNPLSPTASQPPTVALSSPVAAFKTSVAVNRPTPTAARPPSTTVQSEPSLSFAPSLLVPSTLEAAPAAKGTVSSAISEQDRIQFARNLVFHMSSCTLPPGNCRFKRCGDLRHKIKHSVSCNTQSCLTCIQLRAFVEYHARACFVLVGEHCKIPFCDEVRCKKVTAVPAATAATAASALATTTTLSSAMSDNDEDNMPLASAANKNITARSSTSLPVLSPRNLSAAPSKDASTVQPTEASARAPNASGLSSTSSPAAVSAAAAARLQAQEYGSLLQIILHVQKCTTSTCAVGKICVENRKLLRQANAPDAPVRAQTLEKVYRHHKVCLTRNNTQNCPICKIGLMPIVTMNGQCTTARATSSSQFTTTAATASVAAASAGYSLTAAIGSSISSTLKRTNSSMTSPRSPSKKLRMTTKTDGKAFSGTATLSGASAAAAADQHSSDLSSTNRNDLRKEEDVLTHTGIDLNTERRAMMMDRFGNKPKKIPEQLHSTKHVWLQNDLFQNDKLTRHMERIARQQGVSLGGSSAATTKIMAHALQEYLKQVMEEMVEAATLRGDVTGQAVDALVKKDLGGSTAPRELTSTDILRVSCDDSFARLRHDDIALRTSLLEEAKREELAEKERSKKRKKVDRVKLQAQEEKDEAEMDIEELAIKDLKERLLQEDKGSVVRVDGRVNESLTSKFQRRVDHQVTIEDASYWLENQKPYINTKLFVRAEAARLGTNTLL